MSKKHMVEVKPSLKKQVATLMTQLAAWQTEQKDDGHNKNNGGEDNGANGGNHNHHALTHQQDN